MRDLRGNPVEVGDTVVFIPPRSQNTLVKGVVVKITKCYFLIEYLVPDIVSSFYGTIKLESSQVIKEPGKLK